MTFTQGISKRLSGTVLSIAVVIFVLTPHQGLAQDYEYQTGWPTFTTAIPVELGYLNVANGNLHLEVPLDSAQQRGGSVFVAKMVYDSRIWRIVSSGTSYVWQPTNVP